MQNLHILTDKNAQCAFTAVLVDVLSSRFFRGRRVCCYGYSLPLERAVADLGVEVPLGQIAAERQEETMMEFRLPPVLHAD
ncbi:MAG: hypothetical protein ABTS16_14715 [Candidatus Accumulibacter phosphatis]|uniref:Uncharacterized protein n=1 Tax=Candidatus Accumulibacter contiguus TaxID=2954381 RepID=A0ABX1T8L2_9PROT|nr:hypothetical protein [Candidatus Accumulibacter contiguus]NMQ04886.1 hypothetical protein [Candidatus Accumulibacter contiguus]